MLLLHYHPCLCPPHLRDLQTPPCPPLSSNPCTQDLLPNQSVPPLLPPLPPSTVPPPLLLLLLFLQEMRMLNCDQLYLENSTQGPQCQLANLHFHSHFFQSLQPTCPSTEWTIPPQLIPESNIFFHLPRARTTSLSSRTRPPTARAAQGASCPPPPLPHLEPTPVLEIQIFQTPRIRSFSPISTSFHPKLGSTGLSTLDPVSSEQNLLLILSIHEIYFPSSSGKTSAHWCDAWLDVDFYKETKLILESLESEDLATVFFFLG